MSLTLSSLRRRGTAALALAATLGGGALVAAPAVASNPGVYSVPYSSTLYAHSHTATGPVTTELTFGQWAARRFPAPTPITTDFVRYSWSPDIYAVSYFDDNWLWTKLTPTQWAHAGYPQARLAGHIEGTYYFAFPGFEEIYAGLNGVGHELTHDEWAQAGYRQPEIVDAEVFKLSWTHDIALYEVVEDEALVSVLTFEDWQSLGQPEPWAMPMLPGDVVCAVPDSADLRYAGATFEGVLTYAQWQAAGLPAPLPAADPLCQPAA